MKTLIRNCTVVAMDDVHGADPFAADVLLDDQRIAAVGQDLDSGPVDELIDGRERGRGARRAARADDSAVLLCAAP